MYKLLESCQLCELRLQAFLRFTRTSSRVEEVEGISADKISIQFNHAHIHTLPEQRGSLIKIADEVPPACRPYLVRHRLEQVNNVLENPIKRRISEIKTFSTNASSQKQVDVVQWLGL